MGDYQTEGAAKSPGRGIANCSSLENITFPKKLTGMEYFAFSRCSSLKNIEAAGKEFDPNFHNAVMHIEDENFGENIISMELQKGYMYRDSVVRHSMVQVAN